MRRIPSVSRGDVVLCSFPYTDLSVGRVRPGLVVARSHEEDWILAFITSQQSAALSPAAHVMGPSDPEFPQTGLSVSSVIRFDKLATLHRNLLRRRLGNIGPAAWQAAARCLRYVFSL